MSPAPWAVQREKSRGRLHPEPEAPTRSPWQRDRDRIIHCSAFRKLQYKFDLDQPAADDVVIEHGGARVIIDPASLDLLAGAELDYADELMGSYFAVRNPQAKSSCGCGTSFSVD